MPASQDQTLPKPKSPKRPKVKQPRQAPKEPKVVVFSRGPRLNRAYYYAWTSQKRFCMLKGGAGSGKSVLCAQKLLHRCATETDGGRFAHRFLVIRKFGNKRKGSVYKLLKDEIARQGLGTQWRAYDGALWFKHLPTGAEIVTEGYDDEEKIKSIAGITGIWVEEMTEITKKEFSQLNVRLRGVTPYYKQILGSFNPIQSTHWIAEQMDTPRSAGKGYGAYSDPEKLDLFLTTYKHNEFIDDEYRQELEDLVNVDENLYRIYVLGEWGIEDKNLLFAKDFDKKRHVSTVAEYDPNLGQVWLAFDFNVANTCLIIQYDETRIHVIKEYYYEAGDLQELAYEVQTDLAEMKATALAVPLAEVLPDLVTINGDASGGNRSGLSVGRATAYDQLRQFFGDKDGNPLSWGQFRVPDANPGHTASRLVTNMVLKNERQFFIHPRNKKLIRDLENVKFDFAKNQIDKKDPSLTHLLDALRYFIWAELNGRLVRYGISPIADKLGVPWAQRKALDEVEDEEPWMNGDDLN